MNKKRFFLIALLLAASSAYSSEKHSFEMPVEKINELNGFVLKGLALSGTVKSGCITNENKISIKRKGKVIHTEKMRLLEITGLKADQQFNGEAYTGETIQLYIPDVKKDAILVGDVVVSTVSVCAGGPVRK